MIAIETWFKVLSLGRVVNFLISITVFLLKVRSMQDGEFPFVEMQVVDSGMFSTLKFSALLTSSRFYAHMDCLPFVLHRG